MKTNLIRNGFIAAGGLFFLGFLCTLFLTSGKQFALASISFIASFGIATVTAMCLTEKKK